MDRTSISQSDQRRKAKALQIAVEDRISPEDFTPHVYRIHSQTTLGVEYLVDLPASRCECQDNRRGHQCKHLLAAHIYELAEKAAIELARKKNVTLIELESRLLNDLCQGVFDFNLSQKLTVLLHGTQRLIQRYESETLEEIEKIEKEPPWNKIGPAIATRERDHAIPVQPARGRRKLSKVV
jgi:hypothetical protein